MDDRRLSSDAASHGPRRSGRPAGRNDVDALIM